MDEPKLRGYAVERLLGSGATGDVWQARVGSAGARVALKRIVVADAAQRRRAEAEAGLLAALEHPNLVRLHATVPADGAVFLVLDLADGGSLAELLHARGTLTPGEVVTAVAPIADALRHVHDVGVVHGDVSAGNVLFTALGVPLLADVGVARLTGDDADAEATPGYVDPTVAAGGVPGPPSDVFMLGGLALHALTGAPPWPDESAEAALARAAAGEPTDFAERLAGAGAPAAMSAVVLRALSADPRRRGTAGDFALELGQSAVPVAVELSAGRTRPEPQPIRRAGPRHAAQPGRGPGEPLPADPGRPDFARPAVLPDSSGAPPPTRMVGPRPRPVVARRPRPRTRRRWLLGVAAGLVLAAAAGGTVWARDPGEAALTATSTPTQSPARATPRPQVETSSAPAGGTDWGAVLDALDARRSAAFDRRDPGALRQVYLPGRLLTADTALLTRIVPAGCRLSGARTRYTALTVTRAGARTIVTATAQLAPSQLSCAGRPSGAAPGAGPTRLRFELVQTAAGIRIAGERPVSAG